ncbi:MAG: rhamnulokinase family protein [Planctomycetota bacterium]|nr:rhamnulokinase family protein [Planctomycetota bacterium]
MATSVYLAIDLGASSGRHLAGTFDGKRLALEEIYRFENGPVPAAGHLYWDLLHQWSNVVNGLRAAAALHGERIRSIGVDTWGVDFGLLGRGDELLGNPYNYRDPRTDGMQELAFSLIPRDEIYAQTGLQFMQINTLYQLLAMKQANSPILEKAESFLMMPDLFHWLLSGVKANEFTIASTTQFHNPREGIWAVDLFEKLQLPTHILGDLIQPGHKLGTLLPTVAANTGLKRTIPIVVPGTHDTASAVAAVPAASATSDKPDWCYISSGTWSLMGVELPHPVINAECLARNFTNEGGVGGTTRLLKNICGLWLVQECRRVWSEAGTTYSWEYLTQRASEAPPLAAFINPDDPCFLAPADMPTAIRDYCTQTGQTPPANEGAIIRCALESLALKYRQVLGWLEELTGSRLSTVHIVGGGTQNRQLCQMAADATQRPVVAGPVEATAIGNLLVQAIADGAIGSLQEARAVVRQSFSVEEYTPKNQPQWDEAYERFLGVIARR